MAGLTERERAFEARHAHDEELMFLVTARRDKLLAGWVAERSRLTAAARSRLVASVLALRDGPPHDALVLAAIAAACSRHGDPAADEELAAAMDMCADLAQRQLIADTALPGPA